MNRLEIKEREKNINAIKKLYWCIQILKYYIILVLSL